MDPIASAAPTAAGAEREIRLSTAKAEGDGSVRFKVALRLAMSARLQLDGRCWT
jgi:hypothetical protein